MKTGSTATATKQDITDVRTEIAAMREIMATKDDLRNIRNDMSAMRKEMATKQDLQDMKNEIYDGVRVLNENLFYDFKGAFSDRTEVLKDNVNNHRHRIVRIEKHLNFFPEG